MNGTTGLTLTLFLTAAFILPFTPLALAEPTATQKMAQIVSQLNHWPSDNDKEILREISKKGNTAEKTIANALMMMDHRVSSDDKAKLHMVIEDRSVPENTRELAKIVKSLNHRASAKEREILQDM